MRHNTLEDGGTDTSFLQQETLNFWKQLTHVLKYFRAEEDPKARLPKTFIAGFLEVRNSSMVPDHDGFPRPFAPYAMLYAVLTSFFLPCRAATKEPTLCT